MKKIISLALISVMTVLLIACGSNGKNLEGTWKETSSSLDIEAVENDIPAMLASHIFQEMFPKNCIIKIESGKIKLDALEIETDYKVEGGKLFIKPADTIDFTDEGIEYSIDGDTMEWNIYGLKLTFEKE